MLDLIKSAAREVRDDLRDNGDAPDFDWKTNTVFAVTAVLLTVFYYFGRSGYFRRSEWGIEMTLEWMQSAPEYVGLLPYAYWGCASIVIRVVIPILVILLVLREDPREYGLKLKGTFKHVPIYIGLYLFMLPFLYWASTQSSFQNNYPFWEGAANGGEPFLWYELFYGFQFVGVEFFFRGWLIFALYKRFGWHALTIMAIPYVMIHFNKPIPETLGAFIAGFVLGYLAIKSGSVIWGIALHWGIAITMDVFAIAQSHGGLTLGLLRSLVTGVWPEAAAIADALPPPG